MNNPHKPLYQELELKEFKLNSTTNDIRIPLLPPPSTEMPIYKPVNSIENLQF